MTVRDERFEALLGTAAALVAAVFDALPDAIGVVWPIVDETGALVDFEVGYTNPSSERTACPRTARATTSRRCSSAARARSAW